eukprot:GEMP01077579.1.p1 GENE.GEMP01077579.1~~GEMP01077579.1.p1  ORF type:complete len:183 (+),score=50.48 GEMP01077579.1:87-635(+)
MAWKELRWRRCRDMLHQRLLRGFDADTLESQIIQTDAFRPILTIWAQHLVNTNTSTTATTSDDAPRPPSVALAEGMKSRDADVRWCMTRLMDQTNTVPKSRGLPHFPSTLLRRGPKYPFEPYEMLILRQKLGSLRGHELTRPITLPDVPPPVPRRDAHMKDMWHEEVRDDDDLIDVRKRPYL